MAASPYPRAVAGSTLRIATHTAEDAMAKSLDKRKEQKKKPEKTLKEKRAEKKEKKAGA